MLIFERFIYQHTRLIRPTGTSNRNCYSTIKLDKTSENKSSNRVDVGKIEAIFCSVLEDVEKGLLPFQENASFARAMDPTIFSSIESSRSLEELDKTWRDFKNSQEYPSQLGEILLARSRTISRLAKQHVLEKETFAAFDEVLLKRALGAFNRVHYYYSQSKVGDDDKNKLISAFNHAGVSFLGTSPSLTKSLFDFFEAPKNKSILRTESSLIALGLFSEFLAPQMKSSLRKELVSAAKKDRTNVPGEFFDEITVLRPDLAGRMEEFLVSLKTPLSPVLKFALLVNRVKQVEVAKAMSYFATIFEDNSQRTKFHYRAVALGFFLKNKYEKENHTRRAYVEPKHIHAVEVAYRKDFPGEPIDQNCAIDFAMAYLTCYFPTYYFDPKTLDIYVSFIKTLKKENIHLPRPLYGKFLDKLSRKRDLNLANLILLYMKEQNVSRDVLCDNAILKFYLTSTEAQLDRKKASPHKVNFLDEDRYFSSALLLEMLQRTRIEDLKLIDFVNEQISHIITKEEVRKTNQFKFVDSYPRTESEQQGLYKMDEIVTRETFEVFAGMFFQEPDTLRKYIQVLEADLPALPFSEKDLLLEYLYHLLIESYGNKGLIDQVIESVAEMQMKGLVINAYTIHLFVSAFLKKDRLKDAVAHSLGLARTFRITPYYGTYMTLLNKARKLKDQEEEGRIMQMTTEFPILENKNSRTKGKSYQQFSASQQTQAMADDDDI